MEHFSLAWFVRGTWRERTLWRWANLSMGFSLGDLVEFAYAVAYVWKMVLGRVSLHIGFPLGKLGWGLRYREL
jgi:hypothetical protein